jgi:ADP-ribosylglycohydrolase
MSDYKDKATAEVSSMVTHNSRWLVWAGAAAVVAVILLVLWRLT